MNKRMMKKKIPKNTCYCYSYEKGERIPCPWWRRIKSKLPQEDGYCKYLKKGDWDFEYFSLLWDKCKECGLKECK